jgi:hypothetical protein
MAGGMSGGGAASRGEGDPSGEAERLEGFPEPGMSSAQYELMLAKRARPAPRSPSDGPVQAHRNMADADLEPTRFPFIELLFRNRPGGAGTDYVLDPHLIDPAGVGQWAVSTSPRGIEVRGARSLKYPLIGAAIGLLGAAAMVTLFITTSLVDVVFLVIGLLVFGLVLLSSVALARAVRRHPIEEIVLSYDGPTRRLVVHGAEIDPADIEAVERVSCIAGVMNEARRNSGGSFTTYTHLVLRERVSSGWGDPPPEGETRSADPAMRYRVVASGHAGLRWGRRVARQLGVPWRVTRLGTFVHRVHIKKNERL